jgi:hypothetical protein
MASKDEEMVAALLEEEAKAANAIDDDEHMKILFGLLAMYTRDLKPRHGGSRPGGIRENQGRGWGLLHVVRRLLR